MLTICLNHFCITVRTHTHTSSEYMSTIKLMAALRCQIWHCISLSEHILFFSCHLSSRKACELHSMTAAFDHCKQLDLDWTGFFHGLKRRGGKGQSSLFDCTSTRLQYMLTRSGPRHSCACTWHKVGVVQWVCTDTKSIMDLVILWWRFEGHLSALQHSDITSPSFLDCLKDHNFPFVQGYWSGLPDLHDKASPVGNQK